MRWFKQLFINLYSAEFSEWSECSGNCEDEDGIHSRINLSTGEIETEACNRIRCRKYFRSNFRSISGHSVSYKILTKIIDTNNFFSNMVGLVSMG